MYTYTNLYITADLCFLNLFNGKMLHLLELFKIIVARAGRRKGIMGEVLNHDSFFILKTELFKTIYFHTLYIITNYFKKLENQNCYSVLVISTF